MNRPIVPSTVKAGTAPTYVPGSGDVELSPLLRDYDEMRAKLETLLAQPVKDMAEVDRLVDGLEKVQLRIKAQLGIQGNNPNE
ncbi:MAG: hypothetical protein V4731_11655 [Pseudomonadota bacterium]